VMAAPARIVKWAADPKSTGAGPAASNCWGGARQTTARRRINPRTFKVLFLFTDVFFILFLSFVALLVISTGDTLADAPASCY
jgi:hypothetical protein